MDKNTLSEFGWIVIAIIIIAAIILLAPILNRLTSDGANKYIDQFFGVEKEQLKAPDLSFDYENLIITAKSAETKTYDLYIDGEYVEEIKADHPSTYYNLTHLTAGDHPISVVAKAKGYKNSPAAAATAHKLKPPYMVTEDIGAYWYEYIASTGDDVDYYREYSESAIAYYFYPSSSETEKYVSFEYDPNSIDNYKSVADLASAYRDSNSEYAEEDIFTTTGLSNETRNYTINGSKYEDTTTYPQYEFDGIGENYNPHYGRYGSGNGERFAGVDEVRGDVGSGGCVTTPPNGEHTGDGVYHGAIGIKARADGWIDSDWVGFGGRKLKTPTLSHDYENLIIANNDEKTQKYSILFVQGTYFRDTTLALSEIVKYNLSNMKSGDVTVSVVATANGYTDSDPATIDLYKLKTPELTTKNFKDPCDCTPRYYASRAVKTEGDYLITTVVSGAVCDGEKTIMADAASAERMTYINGNRKEDGTYPLYSDFIKAHKITSVNKDSFCIAFKARSEGYIDSNWARDTHVHEFGDWSYRCTYFHSRTCKDWDETEFEPHTGAYIDLGKDGHEITCTTCGSHITDNHNYEVLEHGSDYITYRCKQCGREKKYVDDKNLTERTLFNKYNSNYGLMCDWYTDEGDKDRFLELSTTHAYRYLSNFYEYAEENETHHVEEKSGPFCGYKDGVAITYEEKHGTDRVFELVKSEDGSANVAHTYSYASADTLSELEKQGCPVCTECGHVLHCYKYTNLENGKHSVSCYCGKSSINATRSHEMHYELDNGIKNVESRCYQCGYKVIIDMGHDHELTDWTCFDDKQHERHCTVSGCSYTEYEDHKFVNNVCTVCGYEKGSGTGSGHEHEWSEWKNLNDSYHQRSCDCGAKDFAEHRIYYIKISSSKHAVYCLDCDYYYELDHVMDNGKCHFCGYGCTHSFGDWVEKDSTCTEPGSAQRTCTICGFVEIESYDPKGHDYVNTGEIATLGTCVTQSTVIYRCSRCGDEISKPGLYGEHSYNSRCDVLHKYFSATEEYYCTSGGGTYHIWDDGGYCCVCTYCGEPYKNKKLDYPNVYWCAKHGGAKQPVYTNPTGKHPMQHHK